MTLADPARLSDADVMKTGCELAGLSDEKRRSIAEIADRLGSADPTCVHALSGLWDAAFEQGRLAALDEFQDRFCVCMK